MDKRLISIVLAITNIIGLLELPLYFPFLAFIMFSSSLAILYEAQLSLISTLIVSIILAVFTTLTSIEKVIIVAFFLIISLFGKNKWIYSILLSLVPGLLLGDSYFILIILALLIILLAKIGEVRAIILSGIIYLIVAGIMYSINSSLVMNLSNLSYYYLLMGVIGVIAESRKINYRKFMIYFSFIPASFLGIMLGFPKDSSLIYLFSQNSFYSSFIYLPWVLEYNHEQHILIGWLVIRILLIIVKNSLLSAQVFLGIFTFLSGVISYFVFSKLNLRYPLLLSLLYQFNIFNPVVNYSVSILPYAFLPLSLFLVYYNKKIMYAISTLVAAVSIPLFISSLVIAGVNKKYNLIGYGLGLNAFWLIPYLVFYHGLPSVSPLYLLVGLLFLSLGLLLYYLEYKRKDILYVSLISLILLVIGFNVTPLLFLYLILLIGSLKSIKTLLNASLIVLIAISLISFSYGLSLRYQNVTYYTLDLQMPKTGIYGFGAQTDNLTKLLTSGIAYNAVNYSTKYFLYDGKIIYNPLYFGYPFAPIPNYSSIIRFSYAYTNSGEIFFIYSPFNQLLGILWYPLSNDSELTLTFPFSVKSLQGVQGIIKNNSIEIFSSTYNSSVIILGGNITVNGRPIFSSYYKPEVHTSIGIGEVKEEIETNTSIFLPVYEPVIINGNFVNHSVVLKPGKYIITFSNPTIMYVSYISIFISIITVILLLVRRLIRNVV